MEVVRSILAAHIAPQAFLGRSRKECQIIDLSFQEGFITWTMVGHAPVVMPSTITQPAIKFFDSFFAFYDYVNEINAVCRKFSLAYCSSERINQIAAMIKSAYPSCKFVLGCPVQIKVGTFTCESLVRYLKQNLVFDEPAFKKAELGMNHFLSNNGFMLSTETLLTLDVDLLNSRFVEFDRKQREDWNETLTRNCQPQDENTVWGAMQLGDRCRIPQLAAHLYLQEREKRNDPDYQRKIMLEARMAKYDSKSNLL